MRSDVLPELPGLELSNLDCFWVFFPLDGWLALVKSLAVLRFIGWASFYFLVKCETLSLGLWLWNTSFWSC